MSADAIKLSNCGPYPAAPKVTTLTLVAGADPWNLAPECLSVLVISSLSSCCLCSASSRSILDESSPAASIFPIIVNEYADKYCHEFEG